VKKGRRDGKEGTSMGTSSKEEAQEKGGELPDRHGSESLHKGSKVRCLYGDGHGGRPKRGRQGRQKGVCGKARGWKEKL